MPLRRVRSGVVGRRPRQATDWGRIVMATASSVGVGTKILLGSLVLANPGIGEVVRRTRGVLFVTSDQTTVSEDLFGALGAVVVTDAAAAVGVSAMPGPVTDRNDDGWFMWVPFMTRGADTIAASNIPWFFDSKAMRKIPDGFQVAFIVENASVSFAIEAAIAVSVLSSRT